MKNIILFDSFSNLRERMSYLRKKIISHHLRGGGRAGALAPWKLRQRPTGRWRWPWRSYSDARPNQSEGYNPRPAARSTA